MWRRLRFKRGVENGVKEGEATWVRDGLEQG